MIVTPVTTKEDIKKGDIIIFDDGGTVRAETVDIVKVSEHDGVEIIYNKKKNRYFSLTMFLKGESWVKEVSVVSSGE